MQLKKSAKVIGSSKTLIPIYQTVWCHIPEQYSYYIYHGEIVTSEASVRLLGGD
jgi:hypothetical protein